MQAPNEHNPEFEMYRQVLMRERRTERIQGWIFAILGAVLTLLASSFLIWSFQRILTYGLFSLIPLFVCALGFLTFSLGLSSLRRASKLPTVNEIAHTRRFYRSRLLQQAQGKLPWSYRRSGRIVLTSVGVLVVLMALLVLATFGFQSWDAWIEGACGMLLVLYALVIVPYERRRLPGESAELLAQSLVAGEVTEGVPLEQEER